MVPTVFAVNAAARRDGLDVRDRTSNAKVQGAASLSFSLRAFLASFVAWLTETSFECRLTTLNARGPFTTLPPEFPKVLSHLFAAGRSVLSPVFVGLLGQLRSPRKTTS